MNNYFSARKYVAIIFLIIVLFAAFLRIYNLNQVSMYGDELTIVYDTYSILKTGHDQLGNFLPITFPMGAGRPGGYIYGSLPFVALFGPSVFGVRGLSIFSGLGIILLSYFLARGLSLPKGVGVIVGFLLAITPWAINLSRGGFESHFALFLALLGFTCLLYVKQKPFMLLLSAFSFGIAIHSYPTYKLTLPLMILLFGWFIGAKDWFFDLKIRKYFISSIIILVFFGLVSLWQTFNGVSDARFLSINIFSDETITRLVTENVVIERNLSETPSVLDPLFHNRYVRYPILFLKNYFESLSVRYLFLDGDYNPRHNMTQSGAFFAVELITISIGLLYLYLKKRKLLLLLLGWIFIAPIATSLLTEVHTLRNSLLFMPLTLLSGIGLYVLLTNLKTHRKYLLLTLFILFFGFIQLMFMYEKLYFVAPNLFSRHWAYPAAQLSAQIEKEKRNYDYVVVRDNIDNIEYAYPTYSKTDPNIVIHSDKNKVVLNNLKFKQFGNVYIGGIADSDAELFLSQLSGRVIYFANVEQMKTLTNYSIVTGKDNLPSYIVKEVHK